MGKGLRIVYICNGLDKCSERPGCFRCATPGFRYCRHTFNARCALNGKVRIPEKYPERFHVIELSDSEKVYWEGDVDIPYDEGRSDLRTS